MRRLDRDVPPVSAALLASLMLWPAATLAQATPETFAATATVKRAGVSASAPVSVTITRYSSDDERDAVMAAVRAGGSARPASRARLAKDAGFIQLGDRRTAIKFVGQRCRRAGRLLTIVTAEPILFLGAGLPEPRRRLRSGGGDAGTGRREAVGRTGARRQGRRRSERCAADRRLRRHGRLAERARQKVDPGVVRIEEGTLVDDATESCADWLCDTRQHGRTARNQLSLPMARCDAPNEPNLVIGGATWSLAVLNHVRPTLLMFLSMVLSATFASAQQP